MLSLKSLNVAQKAAVEYISGHSIVVAGPGSGKTRVITYKIAYLIEQGFDPNSILCMTFTNKAANEMKSRIKELIGNKADYLWAGTFHSVFARILRKESAEIGYTSNFSIYDSEDSNSLVANIMGDLKYELEDLPAIKVRKRISFLKNLMIFPDNFTPEHDKYPHEDKFIKIYQEYQNRLVINNAMDFDDLLIKPLDVFKNKKLLTKYRKMFSFILVDEFQDTNTAQYELLKQLLCKDAKICVVGDDAQSIYSWRGAQITNMINFSTDFPKAKTFKLEQNYRSTKMILNAASSVIEKNNGQIPKTIWSDNEVGDPVYYIKCSDEKDEAYHIARQILEDASQYKFDLKDFCVLYRTNAQSRVLEDVFRMENISYNIVGGVEFYNRKEVKDIIAYLKVLVNQKDEESLLRIMNFPQRGIGMTTIKRMLEFARRHNITLFDTMTRVYEVITIKERIQKNVKGFKVLLDKYVSLKEKLKTGELTLALIQELEIVKLLQEEHSYESAGRLENVQELMNAITIYSKENPGASLEDYLQSVSLLTDLDKQDGNNNVVSLMTIHSAKGLEFPVVFVSGLEEEVFPLANKFNPESNLEEERRLFFVALTRAKQKAYLSYARSRYRFGEVAYQNRSRFIDEIAKEYCSEFVAASKRGPRKTKKDMLIDKFKELEYVNPSSSHVNIKVGIKVMHDTFGLGKVVQLVGSGESQKVTVAFEGNNIKQLMLKFAKLKVMS